MTDAPQLAELETLCAAATPGRWSACTCGKCDQLRSEEMGQAGQGYWCVAHVGCRCFDDDSGPKPRALIDADMKLIAELKNALPRLLAAVREGRKALEEAQIAVAALQIWARDLRPTLINADSELSLWRHRYRRSEMPDDMEQEVEETIRKLRAAWNRIPEEPTHG